ncbi:MAG: ThuA domain-containing protein [Candidatus Hodarchaeota archaeon]
MSKIRVTVWNEYRHEPQGGMVSFIYPKGIHEAIAEHLRTQEDMEVRTATLDEPDHGLTDEVLNNTDVLIWWGHTAHEDVRDDIVDKIQLRILHGMGLIVLHSAHKSKIFMRMMGTSGGLKWRDRGEKSLIWVVNPYHPIAKGIEEVIELPHEEMYGDPFDIPPPEDIVFISWFEGGEVFRSGCTWHRGKGKVFYFQAGHEMYPNYYNPDIRKVIENACRWAKFEGMAGGRNLDACPSIGFTLNPLSNPAEREEDWMDDWGED